MKTSMGTPLLILAAISFITVIGGAVYEHVTSVAMFQAPYGIAAFRFWIPIHPVTVLLLIAALAANWKTERRKWILITLGGYVAVLVVTALYFVPQLMSITQTPYASTIDPELTRRAKLWETLSLVRLSCLFVMAYSLLFGLSKAAQPKAGPG